VSEEELTTLCAGIISHIEDCKSATIKSLKSKFEDYDAQEIMDALQQLMSEEHIYKNTEDGLVSYSIITKKITIEQVNQQIDQLKTKINGIEIHDFDLKISALKKIGEIMSDDIQELLNDAQAVDKSLRFGMHDGYPETDRTNISDFVNEVNDLVGVLELMQENGIELPHLFDRLAIDSKKERVNKYMDVARRLGTLS